MFADKILPQFKQFCIDNVLSRDYDYLVPLEAKGILIMNHVLRGNPEWEGRVRYLRSFDFDEPRCLSDKKIALMDDTLVYGKTLENGKRALLARGATYIDKYACMRRLDGSGADDVTCAVRISLTEYDLMLEELSALTLAQRPNFPDHLSYVVRFKSYHSRQSLLLTLRRLGLLVEHQRAEDIDYSLHYPTFAPELPAIAKDVGPNKVRIRIGQDEQHIIFSPSIFPSISSPELLLGTDQLVKEFYDLLDRPWQTNDTRRLNVYEAFTLSLRARMSANFVFALESLGLPIADVTIKPTVHKYFGATVGQKVIRVAESICRSRIPNKRPPDASQMDTSLPSDLVSVAYELLSLIRGAYKSQNQSVADRAMWKSTGFTIGDLVSKTKYSREAVSVSIELLNDYGYVVPMQQIHGPAERFYRSTEIGERKLASTYGATDC